MRLNRMKTMLYAVCAGIMLSVMISVPVKAETAFDPYYYFETYKDVAAVTGMDQQALFNHYQTCGMKEGRFPNAQASWRHAAGIVDAPEDRVAFLMVNLPSDPENANSKLPKMDPVFYYNTYPDVAAVIGKDPLALLNHYFACGFSEGRLPFYGAEPCTEIQTSF